MRVLGKISPATLRGSTGYCERFNSKIRNEFLNGEIFHPLQEVGVLTERWRVYFNSSRHTPAGLQTSSADHLAAWSSPAR